MPLLKRHNLKVYDESGILLFTRYCADKQAVRHAILHDNIYLHRIAWCEYRNARFTISEVYQKFPIGFLVKNNQQQRADNNG